MSVIESKHRWALNQRRQRAWESESLESDRGRTDTKQMLVGSQGNWASVYAGFDRQAPHLSEPHCSGALGEMIHQVRVPSREIRHIIDWVKKPSRGSIQHYLHYPVGYCCISRLFPLQFGGMLCIIVIAYCRRFVTAHWFVNCGTHLEKT